jgi:DNA-binding CsgD family transcriptional regulator
MEEQLVIGIRAKQRRVIGRWALTPREMEVLSLFMQNPRSRVARMCSLSVETVKMHLKHIYTKLKVHSKRALMQCIRDTLDEK